MIQFNQQRRVESVQKVLSENPSAMTEYSLSFSANANAVVNVSTKLFQQQSWVFSVVRCHSNTAGSVSGATAARVPMTAWDALL